MVLWHIVKILACLVVPLMWLLLIKLCQSTSHSFHLVSSRPYRYFNLIVQRIRYEEIIKKKLSKKNKTGFWTVKRNEYTISQLIKYICVASIMCAFVWLFSLKWYEICGSASTNYRQDNSSQQKIVSITVAFCANFGIQKYFFTDKNLYSYNSVHTMNVISKKYFMHHQIKMQFKLFVVVWCGVQATWSQAVLMWRIQNILAIIITA